MHLDAMSPSSSGEIFFRATSKILLHRLMHREYGFTVRVDDDNTGADGNYVVFLWHVSIVKLRGTFFESKGVSDLVHGERFGGV